MARTFRHSFAVDADIDRVWDFYTDINHLKVITPPQLRLEIVRTTAAGNRLDEGAEVWLSARYAAIRARWHSKITFARKYVYVDEMLEGLFPYWRHTHTFEKEEGDTKTTIVKDEVEFEMPYGVFGKLVLEGYAMSQLEKIFAHRKEATIRALSRR